MFSQFAHVSISPHVECVFSLLGWVWWLDGWLDWQCATTAMANFFRWLHFSLARGSHIAAKNKACHFCCALDTVFLWWQLLTWVRHTSQNAKACYSRGFETKVLKPKFQNQSFQSNAPKPKILNQISQTKVPHPKAPKPKLQDRSSPTKTLEPKFPNRISKNKSVVRQSA